MSMTDSALIEPFLATSWPLPSQPNSLWGPWEVHAGTCWDTALVWAETQLIFFIAVYVVLCFGFVTKTVSIIHETSATAEQHLHNIKAFSVSHITLPRSSLGMCKELGEDTAMTADPVTKGMFHTHCIMLRVKVQGKGGRVEIQIYCVCLSK